MGKRKRTKNNKKKQREHSVTLDMGEPTVVNGYSFDPQTGDVSLLYNGKVLNPIHAVVEQTYERTKGPKILNRIETHPAKLNYNPNKILEQFDAIFAVDTNTKIISSSKISVTGVVYGENVKSLNPRKTFIKYRPLNCVEMRNILGKAENIGWVEVIEGILKSSDYSLEQKVAIVVDSDLGEIDFYNKRTRPIVPDYFLPKNFSLVYASADSGSENLANHMLKLSDKISNVILKGLKEKDTSEGLTKVEKCQYSHIRIWNPKD